ncbi:MAG: hypothetical protein AAF694_12920 [Bacteroidota bacterium]
MNRLVLIIFPLSLFFLFGCNNDPGFSNEPTLTFVDIQPRSPRQFRDTINITVSFTDGDGDLGDDNNEVKNIFVIDNRPWLTEEQAQLFFTVPNLTPNTKNPAIQGTITVQIPPTIIRPGLGLTEEATTFDVFVIDRADNESNRVTTDSITVIQ